MELSKPNFLRDVLSTLRFIEISSFLLANLIIGFIFWVVIDFQNDYVLIIFITAFLISVLILKNNWIYLWLSPSKNNNKHETIEKESNKESIKVSLKNFFVVFFKQIFFNISYELFPLLVIWVCWFGIWYIVVTFGFFNISTPYFIITTEVYRFQTKTAFFEVITVLGILLGVFQFYLSRQEQKILSKINFYNNRIKQIIWKETTFEKYFIFISKYGVAFEKWVIEVTDPKMTYFAFFKALRNESDAFEGLKKLLFPQRNDRTPRQPMINLQFSYKDSNQKFEAIESRAKIDGHENTLEKSYEEFFAQDKRIESIKEEIEKEINVDEFFILILSNINIVQEVIPDFINQDFLKYLGNSMESNPKIHKVFENCETAAEYRQSLEVIIFQKILSRIAE